MASTRTECTSTVKAEALETEKSPQGPIHRDAIHAAPKSQVYPQAPLFSCHMH